MKHARKLALKREFLAELANDDLWLVAAGPPEPAPPRRATLPLTLCDCVSYHTEELACRLSLDC